jgi:hypothetical protein
MNDGKILDCMGHKFLDKVQPVLFQQYRNGVLIDEELTHNGITIGGKNSLFNVYFGAATQLTAWYFGLIDNSATTINDTTDTMASHAWAENTAYTEATRQQWSPGSASAGSITNGTAATFTINATGTLFGMFLCSNSTKSGTSGTLWSTAAFSTTKSVASGDTVKLTYTLSA